MTSPFDITNKINSLDKIGKCDSVGHESVNAGDAWWALWKWLHTRCLDGLSSRMDTEAGTTRIRIHFPYLPDDAEAQDVFDGDTPEEAIAEACINEIKRLENASIEEIKKSEGYL